jgi:hypothetical protein
MLFGWAVRVNPMGVAWILTKLEFAQRGWFERTRHAQVSRNQSGVVAKAVHSDIFRRTGAARQSTPDPTFGFFGQNYL